jgi:hypothetical protein
VGNSSVAGIFTALARDPSLGGNIETATIVPGFNPSNAQGEDRQPSAGRPEPDSTDREAQGVSGIVVAQWPAIIMTASECMAPSCASGGGPEMPHVAGGQLLTEVYFSVSLKKVKT